MKNLILSEGKHDNMLFKNIFGNPQENYYFDISEIEKIPANKRKESELYSSFKEKSSPYKNLFKSEGGKNKVFKILKMFRQNLINSNKCLHLIINLDSDGTPHKNKFNELMDNWLNQGVCGKRYAWCEKILCENDDLVIYEVDILDELKSTIITVSRVILFKESLEKAIGYVSGNVDDKISDYVKTQNCSIIKDVLFK